jgi:hypothetical protein
LSETEAKVFFRAPKSLINSFDAICKSENITRAEKLRRIIENIVTEKSGIELTNPALSYERIAAERVKWKTIEDRMYMILEKTVSSNRLSTFKNLCRFACQFGTDEMFSKNLDKSLEQLKTYKLTGQEPFSFFALMTFIRYLECVLNRRQVEDAIRKHWLQESKRKDVIVTESIVDQGIEQAEELEEKH